MKEWGKKTGCYLLFLLMLVFAAVLPTEAASYGKLDGTTTMYAWPLAKAKLQIYEDETLTVKREKATYQCFEILEWNGTVLKVKYLETEEKTGYAAADKFLYDLNYQKIGAYVIKSSGMYLYKKASSAKKERFIKADHHSGGITLGMKENYVQMMIKKGKNFYLGWVSAPTFQSTIYGSMLHTDQILADGTYTLTGKKAGSKAVGAGKYKLTYVGDGIYHLQDTKTKKYLEVAGTWDIRLERKSGYFYLRSMDGMRSLNEKGKTVKSDKTATQQWRLKKKYQKPKEGGVVYSQYDPEFGSCVYQNGYIGPRTISTSGCGLISLVNAIYALNGEYITPSKLAKFAVTHGHYFYNAGTADTLYPDVAARWGKTYHFKHSGKTTSFARMKKHLQKKGTAVALVPGHYIAIVAYRSKDKKYLVYDSAVSGSRPTSIYGDWKSKSELLTGRLRCAYFHLFSAL